MKRSEYISSKSRSCALRGSVGIAIAVMLTGWTPAVLISSTIGAWAMLTLSLLLVAYSLYQMIDAFILLCEAAKERRNEYQRAIRPRL